MIEGLFFDGVNLKSGGGSVAEADEFAALIDPDVAKTGLAWTDVAVARAKIAMDAVVRFGFPPKGIVEVGGVLEDL
jgi:hypothetical protein